VHSELDSELERTETFVDAEAMGIFLKQNWITLNFINVLL